jgi:hypothetical protein
MITNIVVTIAVTIAVTVAAGAAAVAVHQVTDVKVNAAASGYSKDQCKNGGWQNLGFKNQGQCVSFFASGGKAHSH